MKEYIRTLKEHICVNKGYFKFFTILPIIGAVIGIGMVLLIMAIDGTGEDYGELGTMLALFIGGIGLIFGGIYGARMDFNMAVSMGKTRKHFIFAEYILLMLETVIITVIAIVIGLIETVLYSSLYPHAVCELGISTWLMNPAVLFSIVFGVPALIMLLGVLLMIFSNNFFWVLWALWMFGCIGLPKIIHAATENPESASGKYIAAVINAFEGIPTVGMIVGMSIIIIVTMILNTNLYKKQGVTI